MRAPLRVSFIGGAAGARRIERVNAERGESLAPARRAARRARRRRRGGAVLSASGPAGVGVWKVTSRSRHGDGGSRTGRPPPERVRVAYPLSLRRTLIVQVGSAFLEEMLRFESPVVLAVRIPMGDLEIGRCPIRRGESVMASLAAANRDPGQYPEPDRFDITRQDVTHHSFGGGAHFCLGAPLARLEAQVAIPAFLQRFPRLRLADEPLEWRALPAFRGLAKLWVLVD